jgi:hypothetical protein
VTSLSETRKATLGPEAPTRQRRSATCHLVTASGVPGLIPLQLVGRGPELFDWLDAYGIRFTIHLPIDQ